MENNRLTECTDLLLQIVYRVPSLAFYFTHHILTKPKGKWKWYFKVNSYLHLSGFLDGMFYSLPNISCFLCDSKRKHFLWYKCLELFLFNISPWQAFEWIQWSLRSLSLENSVSNQERRETEFILSCISEEFSIEPRLNYSFPA